MCRYQPGRRKPIHFRHIDIHHDDLWIQFSYTGHGVFTITSFPHDFNVRNGFQHATKAFSNHRLIVHKLDMTALDRAEVDYLYVTSSPFPYAVRGQDYQYDTKVKCKKGVARYRLDTGPQDWKQYALSLLYFNVAIFVVGFTILALQDYLPLNQLKVNPDGSRIFWPYIGGFGRYVRMVREMTADDYAGFRFS